MRTIIQSTESHLAEYFGSVTLFSHVTGETERAHPFLSTHLLRRMSSDREHECERCLCHMTAVTFPMLVTPALQSCDAIRHDFGCSNTALISCETAPAVFFPARNKKKNMHLFHACHQRSVATQPSGSCRRTLNTSFIPCTNRAGALNFNLDP